MKLPSLLLIVAILIATAGILETNAATVVSSVTTIIGTSFLTTNLTYTVCIGDTVIATYPADPVLLLYNSTGLYT
ncbi:MAG: hypothetical protein GXO26_03770 [Crenarchaeota archaeon]|nr:hypothetical protein [Thermoproteota archaeon]